MELYKNSKFLATQHSKLFRPILSRKQSKSKPEIPHFQLWSSLPPHVKKLLYLAIISVHKSCARRGLAYKLMHYKIDDAIRQGCQGWVSEGTAYNSQKVSLLTKVTTLEKSVSF